MKGSITIMFLCFYVFAYGQDTLRICNVGKPKGFEYAYKVETGTKFEAFKDLTIKDNNGNRLYFKSAENVSEYLGGEIVARYKKYNYIEPKTVYVVVTKSVSLPNKNN